MFGGDDDAGPLPAVESALAIHRRLGSEFGERGPPPVPPPPELAHLHFNDRLLYFRAESGKA